MIRFSLPVDGAPISGGARHPIPVRTQNLAHPNVIFHGDQVVDAVGRPLNSDEEDWLDLLQSIHVADQVCNRGRNEEWNRHIELSLPLRNPSKFVPYLPQLQEIFSLLTHDVLEIQLSSMAALPPVRFPTKAQALEIDSVALLSGGVDSTCAAAAIAAKHGHPCFVSSQSSSHVIAAQNKVIQAIKGSINANIVSVGFKVELKHSHPTMPLPKSDLSQRSRTLLFTGVAGLIAAARGLSEIAIGENGVMAINCPLTLGRMGGFSTHTAHPDILAKMESLMSQILGRSIRIVNPLLHKTKKEVVLDLQKSSIRSAFTSTHSCWVARRSTHCGTCVPCIVRRFAAEAAQVPDVTYDLDVFTKPPDRKTNKFEGIGDYLWFISNVNRMSDAQLTLEYSELAVDGGTQQRRPILDLHRRWAKDVTAVAKQYPSLAALL